MAAREETWDRVMDALVELGLGETPITVKAVAKLAGVARATIYNDSDLLRFIQGYEREQQFDRGYEAGTAAGNTRLGGTGSMNEWARGILHIEPGEQITRELLRRRRAQLSHFLHPDKGGDTALQQSLNKAYEILKAIAA
jgi:hypothetical protein